MLQVNPLISHDSLELTTCIYVIKKISKRYCFQILDQAETTESLDIHSWENSVYKPTPTIIEAAQALYKGHGCSKKFQGVMLVQLTYQIPLICITTIIRRL